MAQRNFGLDVLRCVAIAIVLANHAFLGFFVEAAGVAWEGRARMLSLVSFISIEWLFVLSGFLIGTMMVRSFEAQGTFWSRARAFWLRRWFRTIPNYYLFFAVNVALVAWGLTGPYAVGPPTWQHAVFSQNLYRPEDVPFFFNESWSLALDEWFYLTLPLLVGLGLLLLKANRRAFVAATAALIVVPTALRLLVAMPPEPLEWDHMVRRITVLHLDATGWGVLAAVANRWWPGLWGRHVAARAVVGVALMLVGVLSVQAMFGVAPVLGGALTAWPRFPVAFAITCTGLGTVLALPAITRLPAPHGLARRGVETVSNYSYSIYLSHVPILFLLAEWLEPAPATSRAALLGLTGLWLVATLLVSAGVYHAFEKPTSDLRERFTRKIDASPFGPATPP